MSKFANIRHKCAGGVMVAAPVLGTGAARHGGSSPLPRTVIKMADLCQLFFVVFFFTICYILHVTAQQPSTETERIVMGNKNRDSRQREAAAKRSAARQKRMLNPNGDSSYAKKKKQGLSGRGWVSEPEPMPWTLPTRSFHQRHANNIQTYGYYSLRFVY